MDKAKRNAMDVADPCPCSLRCTPPLPLQFFSCYSLSALSVCLSEALTHPCLHECCFRPLFFPDSVFCGAYHPRFPLSSSSLSPATDLLVDDDNSNEDDHIKAHANSHMKSAKKHHEDPFLVGIPFFSLLHLKQPFPFLSFSLLFSFLGKGNRGEECFVCRPVEKRRASLFLLLVCLLFLDGW